LFVKRGKRRHTPFPPCLGKIRFYLCINLAHKANDCKVPYALNNSRNIMKQNQSTPNYESKINAHNNKRKPTKVWKRKKKEQLQITK